MEINEDCKNYVALDALYFRCKSLLTGGSSFRFCIHIPVVQSHDFSKTRDYLRFEVFLQYGSSIGEDVMLRRVGGLWHLLGTWCTLGCDQANLLCKETVRAEFYHEAKTEFICCIITSDVYMLISQILTGTHIQQHSVNHHIMQIKAKMDILNTSRFFADQTFNCMMVDTAYELRIWI